jgi:MoxR-like ATPase
MTDPDALTLDDLLPEADDLRSRINRFRAALGRFFVAKQEIIDLMCVAAVAQEPLLIVGPPGTAKSDLVLKFKDALGVPQEDYFEYMLTRFTEPSEIIGAIDIRELREGRYIRRKAGKLPTAQLVFLDEIFKSNSAILNILLTIINEKKFYQDGVPEPVPLRVLFAATNEVPEQAELAALKDRFVLKVRSRPVQETHFADLTLLMSRRSDDTTDRATYFPADVFREFQRLVKTLVREDRIFISDRKLVKLYKLLRVQAWLFSGGVVTRGDLRLLAYLGESLQEIEHLSTKVPRLLGDEP